MAEKSASKPKEPTVVLHAFEFLSANEHKTLPTCIGCVGSDDFLRRKAIRRIIESSGLDESTIRSYEGDEATWRDLHDELATRSLFDADGLKLAIVRNADSFVTKYREQLEKWAVRKVAETCLVLEIKTLAVSTVLYKQIAKTGWIVSCTPPRKSSFGNPLDDRAMQKWVEDWSYAQHGVKLTAQQSALIVERVGDVCGLIDCEIAKIALFADSAGLVSDQRVKEMVGGWRTQTTWDVADAIAEGKSASALQQIDKLFTAGQTAVGLFAQLAWSLRRYGVAAQLVEQYERNGQKIALSSALEQAGFNRFDLAKCEQRIKRMGRVRAKELLHTLVDLELKLKGSHSGEDRARMALESLILKLA